MTVSRWLGSGLAVLSSALAGADESVLWPVFRHDLQLTGRSPLHGHSEGAPAIRWAISLDAPEQRQERARLHDLDGDGLPEIVVVRKDGMVCMDRQGGALWEAANLAEPKISDVIELSGDGKSSLLVWARDGLRQTRYVISGATGKATPLYSIQNVFGMEERIGHILPDVQGLQLCAWWSGEPEDGVFDEQVGQGYIFSFENGADIPTVRFHTTQRGVIYSPRHLFCDYDQDGDTEMVMISHQQAFFYDIASAALEFQVSWPQIRTYSATLAMLPVTPGAPPSILSINPHIPGVERVDIVDGQAKVVWRQVVAEKEDQYQTQVKINPGAPDSFLHLDGGERLYILASIVNQHGDGGTCVNVYDAATGEQVGDARGIEFLGLDDLDADGVPECLIREAGDLVVAHWKEGKFVPAWHAPGVDPLFKPAPGEGELSRSRGYNAPVWRESEDSSMFLLRFSDGVSACRWTSAGIERDHPITDLPVLEKKKKREWAAGDEEVLKEDEDVVVRKGGQETFRFVPAAAPEFLASPPVVGLLGGAIRIVTPNAAGTLLSFSSQGEDRRELVSHVDAGQYGIADMNGDGENEVYALSQSSGNPEMVTLDSGGGVLRRFGLIKGSAGLRMGPHGSLGPGKGQWWAACYDMNVGQRPTVVVYHAGTGEVLWQQDYFNPTDAAYGADYRMKFVLHAPTAVYDHDGDGVEDLLAASENYFGILRGDTGAELTPITQFSDCVPGHWQAYACPILAPFQGPGTLQVFHHHAFAQTILTTVEGAPLWHYGLTRDTTPTPWPGIGDVDGDGKLEILQSRVDGLLRLFSPDAGNTTCPACDPAAPLTEKNHSGVILAEFNVKPPVSDIAACDTNGDGRDEFLFGAGDGLVYCMKYDGGTLAMAWAVPLGRTAGSPIVCDLEGDGVPEILAPVEDGRLVCLAW